MKPDEGPIRHLLGIIEHEGHLSEECDTCCLALAQAEADEAVADAERDHPK